MHGLSSWNEDRGAAVSDEQQTYSYYHLLCHAANTVAEEVLGKKIICYAGPRQYTGIVLDYKLAMEQSETNDVEVDEIAAEPEEFQDITVPTFEPHLLPQTRPASCIMPVPALPAASSMPPTSLVPPSPVNRPSASFMSFLCVASQLPGLTSSLLPQFRPTPSAEHSW